jgi:putative Ca2+/H+ antiporter (TMEM165/GDT1 family)
MHSFWLSLWMIFLAELGDKTQLVALTLATRFNAKVVLGGIFTATLVIHIFSALIGGLVGGFLPTDWIKLVAGIAFVGFGLWTLRGDSLDDEDARCRRIASPFWLTFVTFFLAELGDKTMLSTITLAATNDAIQVWLGSTLGMVVSDGLAIWVGRALGTRLPERAIKIGASVIFFAFGAVSIFQGASRLPWWTWGPAAVSVAGVAYLLGLRPGAAKNAAVSEGPSGRR